MNNNPTRYYAMPATHIVLLGSKWDDQDGVAIINGSEPTKRIRELGVISANPEMAMPTMIKLLTVMRDVYGNRDRLREELKPVPDKLATVIALLKEVDACFHPSVRHVPGLTQSGHDNRPPRTGTETPSGES